jgi:hypothetical protein
VCWISRFAPIFEALVFALKRHFDGVLEQWTKQLCDWANQFNGELATGEIGMRCHPMCRPHLEELA